MRSASTSRQGNRLPVATVVFRYIYHYRAEFYERVRVLLAERGVQFRLVAGQPSSRELSKHDAVDLAWAEPIRNSYWEVGSRSVCWQPALRQAWQSDLVIVEQATRLLLNYALLVGRHIGGPRLAFWGHGEHILSHRANCQSEGLKALVSRHVNWWFAYNRTSVEIVRGLGFPADRITCVLNAVDTRALAAKCRELREGDVAAIRESFGLRGSNVGIFVGSLYREKRLEFLVQAADLVRARVPDFELLIVGGGEDEPQVRAAASTRPWLHLEGPLHGSRKAAAMASAKLYLCPGLVGLGVLDAFAADLPIITTGVPFHSHEIAYVEPERNGIFVEEWQQPLPYAEAVTRVLADEALLQSLVRGCRRSAEEYTIEGMSERFASGVCMALARDGATRRATI